MIYVTYIARLEAPLAIAAATVIWYKKWYGKRKKRQDAVKAQNEELIVFEKEKMEVVKKQIAQEKLEEKTKAANPIIDIADLIRNPRKFVPIQKHRVGATEQDLNKIREWAGPLTIEEKRMHALEERPIDDVFFFTENIFFAEGVLGGGQHAGFTHFGAGDDWETEGYKEVYRDSFLFELFVDVDGKRNTVHVMVPHKYTRPVQQKTGAYKIADQGNAFDDFGFHIATGSKLRVQGHLSKKIKANSPNEPLGYYLLAKMKDVQPVSLDVPPGNGGIRGRLE